MTDRDGVDIWAGRGPSARRARRRLRRHVRVRRAHSTAPVPGSKFPAQADGRSGAGRRSRAGLFPARLGETPQLLGARLVHRLAAQDRIHDVPAVETQVEAICRDPRERGAGRRRRGTGLYSPTGRGLGPRQAACGLKRRRTRRLYHVVRMRPVAPRNQRSDGTAGRHDQVDNLSRQGKDQDEI